MTGIWLPLIRQSHRTSKTLSSLKGKSLEVGRASVSKDSSQDSWQTALLQELHRISSTLTKYEWSPVSWIFEQGHLGLTQHLKQRK